MDSFLITLNCSYDDYMHTLSRTELDARCVGSFREAKGTRPDLKLIDLGDRMAVLKDYRNSDPLFRRIVGPILIRRERGALMKLTNVEGVPKLLQAIDRHAILMEHIDGKSLRTIERDFLSSDYFVQLEDLIKRMHRAGVAHCDLRTGGNMMVDQDGRPHVIDFASCVFRGRGLNPFIRWIFQQFRQADLHAVLLAKKKASPSLLTTEEATRLSKPLPFERPAIFIGRSIRNLTRRTMTRSGR